MWYLAAARDRPAWMRVDRLLGEHGIGADTADGRQEFERRMEAQRRQEVDDAGWKPLQRGWCVGSEAFLKEMLERMEGGLSRWHAAGLQRGSAEVRAERVIAEELRREGWTEADVGARRKGDPVKLALAARLRRETTLTMGWIAARLKTGTRQSTITRLQELKRKRKTDRRVPK